MNNEQPDGRYPAAEPCPRCGAPRWMKHPFDCVIHCDGCANDPAVVLAWIRKNRRDDA